MAIIVGMIQRRSVVRELAVKLSAVGILFLILFGSCAVLGYIGGPRPDSIAPFIAIEVVQVVLLAVEIMALLSDSAQEYLNR
jgi:hypothetical protein